MNGESDIALHEAEHPGELDRLYPATPPKAPSELKLILWLDTDGEVWAVGRDQDEAESQAMARLLEQEVRFSTALFRVREHALINGRPVTICGAPLYLLSVVEALEIRSPQWLRDAARGAT